VASEFMGLIHGRYDEKSAGLRPGPDCFECWTGIGRHVDPAHLDS